jgi:hypothetical protein
MSDSNRFQATQNSPREAHKTLREIQRQIETESRVGRCLVIFDLDSTLFDLALRVTTLLHRYAKSSEKQACFPEECSRLQEVEILRGDWGLREPLGRLGITQQQYPTFWQDVHQAWANGFFSNEFLMHDRPLPGAVRFVEDIISKGADVLYLTGRDVARMGAGTEASLRETGFPLDGLKSRLILKPQARLDDAEFKADVIEQLEKSFDNIWLFENEPVNMNAVLRRSPIVKMVFVDTCHSGLETPPDSAVRIEHFEISVEEFE